MTSRNSQPASVRFQVGDAVRVKRGVSDADYPDMPMGGWAGTVEKIEDDGMYMVRWSTETLASIHPIIKSRCEKDGLHADQNWLDAADLQPDHGGPLQIEQPKKIITKPLSMLDDDDRIRMVFGLTSNDPLPDVAFESVKTYRDYLSKKLDFPFTAWHRAEHGSPEQIRVIGLGDLDDDAMADEFNGVFCEARVRGSLIVLPLSKLQDCQGKPCRQLISDYCCWFHNWQ